MSEPAKGTLSGKDDNLLCGEEKVNLLSKSRAMSGEAKKLQLIEEILKIENNAVFD